MKDKDIHEQSDENVSDDSDNYDGGGIIAYINIMPFLDEAPDKEARIKLSSKLPWGWFIIPQRKNNFQPLKDVIEKYHEVIPDVLAHTYRLRKQDKELFPWATFDMESKEYKEFIADLEKQVNPDMP